MKAPKFNRKVILCAVLSLVIIGVLLVPVATVSAAYPPATFTQDWPLQLVGVSTVSVTQAQFQAMAAAHPASYTDNVGNLWQGVAMWRLVALVDDVDNTTFNSAAVNVCTVKETGCDNYTSSWAGSILVSSTSSDNYAMVANLCNGNPLPLANPGSPGKPWYPVRAVGSGIGGVGGGKTMGGLIKIELLNLPATTVRVSPAYQTADNGKAFTVDLAISTDNQSRGWQANVDFDATKMQYTGATEGTFLKNYATSDNGQTAWCAIPPTIDNVNGHVTGLTCAIVGGNSLGGATGTGVLCTLAFTAKPGIDNIASIGLSGVVVSDQNATTIPWTTAVGGTVGIGNVPGPDLVVSALSASKVSSTTYTITYTIANQGNLAAGASTTSVVVDGGAPTLVPCPPLGIGASDTENLTQTFTSPTDTIQVTADSAGVVAEHNEANNSSQIVYSLAYGTGTVTVNGNILAKLNLTVPADIATWILQQGNNSTSGTANVQCNTPWLLQVNDQNGNTNGHMTKWTGAAYDSSVKLANPLWVGAVGPLTGVALSGSPQTIATGDTSGQNLDSGQNLTINFAQQVVYSDPVLSGGNSYHIVVTFTASSTL